MKDICQREITAPIDLLDHSGHITEEGWAKEPYWKYERKSVKAPWFRIKEWDYYIIYSEKWEKFISFTISDLGYAGLIALCLVDMKSGSVFQADTLAVLPRGKITAVPEKMSFSDKVLSISYEIKGETRKIVFSASGMEGELTLHQPPEQESMNIATSWKENRKRFYYNRKINAMAASGYIKTPSERYDLDPSTDYGTLDWGRGAWTYRNRWYWGSASANIKGIPFGFNIGYGFTDRTPASENMLFYKGKAHKLDLVEFHLVKDNYLAPWKFTSSDGRFELDFRPVADRSSAVNMAVIRSIQHQVFGYFTGKVVLDGGEVLELKDFPGFAEDVYNRY